jgi:hypothetical protein
VQLLQGRPITAQSHLTLRARQGTHALLTLRERLPVSPTLCGPLPEVEVFIEGGGAFAVVCNAVDNQGIEGQKDLRGGVTAFPLCFDISAFNLHVSSEVCILPSLNPPLVVSVAPTEYAVYVLTIVESVTGVVEHQ